MGIFGVLELIPEISREILCQQRLGSVGENGITGQLLRLLEMWATLNFLFFSCGSLTTATQFLLLRNHGLHTIVHVLNEVDLGSAQSPLVRNIVDMVSRL